MGLKAEEVGPTLKFWNDKIGIIPIKPFMLQDTKWKFVNDPSSEAFRLWENAAGYYAGKQSVKSGYYNNLIGDSRELIQLIRQHKKE